MSFWDGVQRDFRHILMNTKEQGEEIFFTPSGKGELCIKGVVDREVQLQAPFDGGIQSPANPPYTVMEITILKDQEFGVINITKGKDKVRVKAQVEGEKEITLTVKEIVLQSPAMWTLLCQS